MLITKTAIKELIIILVLQRRAQSDFIPSNKMDRKKCFTDWMTLPLCRSVYLYNEIYNNKEIYHTEMYSSHTSTLIYFESSKIEFGSCQISSSYSCILPKNPTSNIFYDILNFQIKS